MLTEAAHDLVDVSQGSEARSSLNVSLADLWLKKRGVWMTQNFNFQKLSRDSSTLINNCSFHCSTPQPLENTQLPWEDAGKTSKILPRALWVRRSPYRFTFNYPRARMATNAASYNPSKKLRNCHFHNHILTIA
jgi:hypothetical protein